MEVALLTNMIDDTLSSQDIAATARPILPILATDDADAGTKAILSAILESLDDSKAEEIVTIDITGRSSLADAMVIASGRSHRHVGAIADHLEKKLHDLGVRNLRIEGLPHCDWVLVDAGDVMAHLFRPEVRGFYNLEKMWQPEVPAPRLPKKP